MRLDQREHRLDRDRRVDRAAAAAQHVHPGLDRKRIGGGDENLPLRRGRRRLRVGARRAAQEAKARQASSRQERRSDLIGQALAKDRRAVHARPDGRRSTAFPYGTRWSI